MKNEIDKCEIVERMFYQERWYVKLEPSPFGKKIPMAHYIWYINNPYFMNIPKGYVVHHLDGNRLNDDITNLALMGRYHHLAYHNKYLENKFEGVPIRFKSSSRFEERYTFERISNPKYCYQKYGTRYWAVTWNEVGEDGKRIQRRIVSFNGKTLKTEKNAIELVNYVKKLSED